jgi:hypothetical protein
MFTLTEHCLIVITQRRCYKKIGQKNLKITAFSGHQQAHHKSRRSPLPKDTAANSI